MVAHIESHVATKTFTQVNRMVKTLIAPSSQSTVAGYGGDPLTITPAGGVIPFSPQYFSHTDMFLWNPNGDGRSNLSHISTTGTMKTTPFDYKHAFPYTALDNWLFGPGANSVGSTSVVNIDNAPHDPDVRSLYPTSPCRTTGAKMVLDVNMGGGAATLRAVPFTKDMIELSPLQLRANILADRHSVKVLEVGGRGTKDRRFSFNPWVQSRKAVGEFSAMKHYPASGYLSASPVDGEDPTNSGYAAMYTDEFCYGGWVIIFENVAPCIYGTTPYVRIAATLDIQVQLTLEHNHLRDIGPGSSLSNFLRRHETAAATPAAPRAGAVVGGPVEAAIKALKDAPARPTKNKGQSGQGKGGGYKTSKTKNMRGSLSKQEQEHKSLAAAKNRSAAKRAALSAAKNLSNNPSAKAIAHAVVGALGGVHPSSIAAQAAVTHGRRYKGKFRALPPSRR